MADERRKHDEDIKEALEKLSRRITRRVRLEQLRDQLTDLPNEPALNNAIRDYLESNQDFWAAFVEVDRFKSINDEFGYQGADLVLKKLAESLHHGCAFFTGPTAAFRAHGDEFYFLGSSAKEDQTDDDIHRALKHIGKSVAKLRVPTTRGTARCTVSIGWLRTKDLVSEPNIVTAARVLHALELAVAEAKWKRGTVVRYDVKFQTESAVQLRGDCSACRSKFVVTLKRASYKTGGKWRCPNCGAKCARPPIPQVVSGPEPSEEV